MLKGDDNGKHMFSIFLPLELSNAGIYFTTSYILQ